MNTDILAQMLNEQFVISVICQIPHLDVPDVK